MYIVQPEHCWYPSEQFNSIQCKKRNCFTKPFGHLLTVPEYEVLQSDVFIHLLGPVEDREGGNPRSEVGALKRPKRENLDLAFFYIKTSNLSSI